MVRDLLRSIWEEPRPAGARAPAWRDGVLVGLLAIAVTLEALLRTDLPWRAISVALTAGLLPTLLWRRSRPLLMVVILFSVSTLAPLFTGGVPAETYTMVFALILPYSLVRWGSGRETVIGSAIMLVKMVFTAAVGVLTVADTIGGLAVLSTACALGAAIRYRGRARQRELDQVKLLERERLARDLHDTVAHHVSAMAIRAQAGLATAATHPDAAVEALRVIEAEASLALTEMRSMVRVLRHNEPAQRVPSPRVGDLAGLAGDSRTGPAVEVTLEGDIDDLPSSLGAAVYRLAQESVTNARRHARHATRIEVSVAADATSVRLHVSDDGETGPTRSPAPAGFGLTGMIERAGLLGGTCVAGPNPDRGWTVTAVLPRNGSPA
ncbi:two-component sensor histidine kinase [Rhizocola hellebori]|uniref:histidine kinase n=1 Tax=Rhizocola hellebori TaxID=1392758 RepID=A0A8J3Q2J7_9ACTN|nr:histidine kinase [Rhizocola hellebori]GIH02504.1 two-component sensor histidine kinase [Rhizocola hellebori]